MNPFYEVRKQEFSVKNNLSEVQFSPHIHGDIEILHMRKGVQHLKIDGKTYTLSQGQTAFIFPNIIHEYCMETENASEIDAILIICAKKVLQSLFPGHEQLLSQNTDYYKGCDF